MERWQSHCRSATDLTREEEAVPLHVVGSEEEEQNQIWIAGDDWSQIWLRLQCLRNAEKQDRRGRNHLAAVGGGRSRRGTDSQLAGFYPDPHKENLNLRS